ncbi:MAG: hypothetical protein P8X79_22605, partial [Reinekea sp.]
QQGLQGRGPGGLNQVIAKEVGVGVAYWVDGADERVDDDGGGLTRIQLDGSEWFFVFDVGHGSGVL